MGTIKLKIVALSAALLPLVVACGAEEKPKVRRVGLVPLDIRDGRANGDATAGGGGGGDEGSSPEEGGAGGPRGGTKSGGGGSGGGGGNPPASQETDSVAAFSQTVYPLAVKWCGGACHTEIQAPAFAHVDPALAHDSLLTTQKINFKDVAKSRLVLRVSQDNHNCPAEGCEVATTKFIEAIQQWAQVLEKPEGEGGPKLPTSGALKLANAESTRMDSGLPPGVVLLEAEKGVLKAPMVALPVDGAGGGMVVHTPAGAGNQANIQTAATQDTLGTIVFDFDVVEAGTYRLIGRINAPANANSSFYIKMDTANLLLWDFPTSGAEYIYDVADAVNAAGAPHVFNLMAGKHRIEIRQRQEQAKVDKLILTTDAMLEPANVEATPREVKSLAFDLGTQLGLEGAKLTVDVIDYSANAYMFKNPKLVVPSGSVKVKGMKLLINGTYLPQHSTYTVVDTTVAAPGAVLSTAALVALKDKGPEADQFSFTFDVLEKAP